MKNDKNEVIYVGKAKNLKNRVNSYFLRTDELSVAKKQMVAKISTIEWISCDTEVEALVLETNLIKHLSPKYNILMKDDKDLAYIKITKSPVPELIKTRQRLNDGAEYFWPFPAWVEASVRDLRKIFRIRNCRIRFDMVEWKVKITDKAGKTIPCMDYYIGICPGPCILEEKNISIHKDHLQLARSFLTWSKKGILEQLEVQMKQKAQRLEFEDAQKLRDTISSLRALSEKQSVRDIVTGDFDVFWKYEKYDKTYIGIMQIRWGQIIALMRYHLESNEDIGDAIARLFVDTYSTQQDLPEALLFDEHIQDESFLDFLSGKKISIEIPKIWPKKSVLDFLHKQLMEYAYRTESKMLEIKTFSRAHMKSILQQLGYLFPEKWPIIFECYDISHTDGHFTYASRVVIEDGKPNQKKYKKYKIKTLLDGEIDDFASHREVMKRRMMEVAELNNLPHLIIIDGGKGQLSSAMSGFQEGIVVTSSQAEWIEMKWNVAMQVSENSEHGFLHPKSASIFCLDPKGATSGQWQVQICSIAKREEEIFLPNKKEPILFEKWTPELMVLQKARDESHRFSINANKSERMKSMKKNILEEIPWIWPITRKKLLKISGSIEGIKDISQEELRNICTIVQIEALRDHGIIS